MTYSASTMSAMTRRSEPVRRHVYAAAGVVAASTVCLALALVDTITVQAVLGAVGTGLAQFGAIAFAGEKARAQVTPR